MHLVFESYMYNKYVLTLQINIVHLTFFIDSAMAKYMHINFSKSFTRK